MDLKQLGWVAAAGLAAFVCTAARHAPGGKCGVIDIARVFKDCDFSKIQSEKLRAVGESRSELLAFMENYRVLSADQASKLRALYMKSPQADADRAELDRLKKEIQEADQAFKSLQTKPSPTPEEVAKLQELNTRSQLTASLGDRWAKEFNDEVQNLNETLRNETLSRLREAVRDVGKKKGYNLLFTREASPYGANDVTDDALKAMNSRK
ncbi:MAG: OmpH family outer membrane protein [Fimbriimonas ginsengisoli]|uniref:OmpH family outer membrane protein n=1 Tax=Fimbriimonas ginsengisoli TaxID=1005039 RepID=A0A931LXN8_FIMGI|nr:OmpH family outer membrane protein [Fimbriimonas ginsengisoli]